MPGRYNPPKSTREWYAEAKKHGLDATSIYDLIIFKSGSKISEEQFLALRVIWRTRGPDEFNSKDWGIDVSDVQQDLEKLPKWREYTKQLETGLGDSPYFGRFDLLWDFQKQIRDTLDPKDGPSKIRSPINLRHRDPSKRPQYADPQTPTPTSRNTLLVELEALELGQAEEPPPITPASQIYVSPRSPVSSENNDGFPPADDEQTVNTALILLIKAVCIDEPLLSAAWTLDRKIFIFKTVDNSTKLYEARTDGHLKFSNDKTKMSLAILEVKANNFKKSEPEKQQSAQMAAWIRSEPDITTTPNGQYW